MNNKYAIIGDVHSHYTELVELLAKLGLQIKDMHAVNRIDRTLVFVGDFVDRGKYPVETLTLVMNLVDNGLALAVRGNHDHKLLRALKGNDVKMRDETKETLDIIRKQKPRFINRLVSFLDNLPYWLMLDDDSIFIVHGGMTESLQGVNCKKARKFALYGDVTGKYDENGYPIRGDWAKDYRGHRIVVYGHQMVEKPEWRNNTIDIDTGCFNTGILSAVLLPERNIINNKNKHS